MQNGNIQDLVTQLNLLQLSQTELLVLLEQAVHSKVSAAGTQPQTDEEREFSLGNQVLIKNPNPFQTNKGTVTKIGAKRIAVTTTSGTKILQAPKNLIKA